MISFLFRPQIAADTSAIDALHAEVFGPGRFARTAYRIREASTQGPLLALTAWDGGTLAGVIQLTAITVAEQRGAVLLGPIAIAPAYQNRGCGMRLVTDGLAAVTERGYALVILVGDLPYYRKAGFQVIPFGQITLPGPADPARLLACVLRPGALATFQGLVAADNEPPLTAAEPVTCRCSVAQCDASPQQR
jgi:predicted N-acetyltransferase YhbS